MQNAFILLFAMERDFSESGGNQENPFNLAVSWVKPEVSSSSQDQQKDKVFSKKKVMTNDQFYYKLLELRQACLETLALTGGAYSLSEKINFALLPDWMKRGFRGRRQSRK